MGRCGIVGMMLHGEEGLLRRQVILVLGRRGEELSQPVALGLGQPPVFRGLGVDRHCGGRSEGIRQFPSHPYVNRSSSQRTGSLGCQNLSFDSNYMNGKMC